jgi:PAS domain S-box-containing protein
MPQGTTVLALSLAYLGLLFAIAHLGERHAKRWSQSRLGPIVYALSLAIYCTSWTFYGSVGRAATAGPDFILIYVGPTLVMILGYPAMAKMIAVAKRENVTSIADFLGSRYGKSRAVAVTATVIAAVGVLPYIALQLQAVTFSFAALLGLKGDLDSAELPLPLRDTALVVALVMAAFTILFGVRNIQASEQHRGMMLAIAFESIVKLVAFLVVGVFVVHGLFDGWGDLTAAIEARPEVQSSLEGRTPATGWIVMTALAGFAFLCLPRQFHVAVVEHDHPAGLKTARWLFPLYLLLINLFVVPIAAAGLLRLGPGADPDMFVLTLPLNAGQSWLSIFAFIGGLSAATSMIIVACVALSGMIGNELVMPLLLRRRAGESSELGPLVLTVRRIAVCVILALAYLYHQAVAGYLPLVSIGLISFCAVANFAPPLLLGLYWRGAHRLGVVTGLLGGFAVWVHTLLVPSIARDVGSGRKPPLADWMPDPLGGLDFFAQGFLASISVNIALLVLGSLLARATARDIRQANAFVAGEGGPTPPDQTNADPRVDELRALVARFVGPERAAAAFAGQNLSGPSALAHTEHILAGAIGAASARVVVATIGGGTRFAFPSTRQILGQASEAIRTNYELLRKTLDNVGLGIATFDREGRLEVWNERFERMLALPDETMQVGTAIADLAAIAPDIAHVATDRGMAPSRERRRPDGTVVEISVDPLPDGGFVVTATDVTARVRAAEAIRDSERRIRVYTDNVPVLISYIDRDQLYRFVNAPYQAALGLPESDIEGRHLIDVLGQDRYDRLKPYIDGVLAGEPQTFEIEFPTNDAKIEVARGTYLPHVDDAGEVIGFFVLYQDITERRHAEAALRQAAETLERRVAERTAELEASRAEAEAANRGKTRFIAAASHDLLQPLHAARLFTAALAERYPNDELVGKIDQGLASVEALLDALLDISRLDSGALAPDRQPVALGPLIEQLAATFAPVADQRGARLAVVAPDATVTTDPALLRRVLQNLISNALRYGGRPDVPARVLIGCRRAGPNLRIEVWDNGPGIPEDKREIVFEEFIRLASPLNDPSQGRGLGLGLAIVQRIARVLGHPLSLRSKVGHGSVFAITVPLTNAMPALPTVAAPEPASPTAATLVLCVDDEAPVREGMATLLERWPKMPRRRVGYSRPRPACPTFCSSICISATGRTVSR